jgi:hypothetical protein
MRARMAGLQGDCTPEGFSRRLVFPGGKLRIAQSPPRSGICWLQLGDPMEVFRSLRVSTVRGVYLRQQAARVELVRGREQNYRARVFGLCVPARTP